MSESDLPPDVPRLQVVRDWLAGQHDRSVVLETYLRLQLDRADVALAAARERAERTVGQRFRLIPVRLRPGRSELHRDACPTPGGAIVTPEEARDALTDEKVSPGMALCTACRPERALQ